MNIYKIRNKDGLFSTGGSYPQFTKNGKSWTNIGHIKNHLHSVNHAHGNRIGFYNQDQKREHPMGTQHPGSHPYTGCTLVIYELKEAGTKPIIDLL